MTCIRFLLTVWLSATVSFCIAQPAEADSSKKITHNYSLGFYNHRPGFSFSHPSSLAPGLNAASYSFGKSGPKTNYTDRSRLRLDYTPLITRDNYSLMTRPDFYYHYDPTNPYGVHDPLDGVVNGGIDYLLGKIFEK